MNPICLWSTDWRYDLPRAYKAIIATADFLKWAKEKYPWIKLFQSQVESARAYFARKEGIFYVVSIPRGGGKTYVAKLIQEYEARE